ncbi:MAG: hypothetical protein ACI8Z1_003259 [Candidatus Azotimanducaceae bacterium]|jgi:hypothetical protein
MDIVIKNEGTPITESVLEEGREASEMTPGLSHLWVLKQLDRTGLSHWLLGFGAFLTLTIMSVIMLIGVGYPDPNMYKNSIAFTAIISFFLVFYIAMGRGWHSDALQFLAFDREIESALAVIRPGPRIVILELLIAVGCVYINMQVNKSIDLSHSTVFLLSIWFFFGIQWVMIVFCVDVVLRQLISLMRIVQRIRIDLLNAEFYSTLANAMVRHVGLYIFGVCIISLSHIVFTEGELSAAEMMVVMMPWYLPSLVIISLYLIPFNHLMKRMRSRKLQELNCITAVLGGNYQALDHSLLRDESSVSKIDLLYYQDRIGAIKEWPFTDRIRALVLFGILPPLTWVIAALIEILIESSL